jgi:hypothetical protein
MNREVLREENPIRISGEPAVIIFLGYLMTHKCNGYIASELHIQGIPFIVPLSMGTVME